MNHRIASFIVALSLLPACALKTVPSSESTSTPSQYALSLSPADAASVLALVNYPGTDLDTLDNAIGLDTRAAHNIIAYRAGADGVIPSADDAYFANIGDLDAIPYVGDTAFEKLQAYASTHSVPAPESVEGVYFRGWQSQAVVWAVNNLDFNALNALLDSRAANGLIAARPFSSVTEMGPAPYVGPSALGALDAAATGWWTEMQSGATQSLAGSFDGVTFDEPTAETALAIASDASVDELKAQGVTAHPADLIVGARPFATLGDVAAIKGVGTETMQALHDYAASGDWNNGTGPNACIDSFESAVTPQLAGLLFMSESDRPFDVVSFAGAGTSVPTADSVLALVGAPSGDTAEERPVSYFDDGYEPADSGAVTAVEAIVSSQLTDVIYVAIHAPAGSLDQAIVNVYLVGRTQCGDLVGLHSIAIET
jgi:DNA uptake protein ComE-like DNA-binding protein